MTIDIMLDDIVPETRALIMAAYGIKAPQELNLDIVPLFSLEITEEETENENKIGM